MKSYLVISLGISTILFSNLALSKDKDPLARTSRLHSSAVSAAAAEIITLNNGTGDGTVSITVDGYGSFGNSTPAGDAIYDPVGSIGPQGTVYESAVYFSPLQDFLSTDDLGGGTALAPISMQNPDSKTAISQFDANGFHIKLRQKLNAATSKGSTLVQTYVITNNTGSDQTITMVRHVDGDLYFSGGYGNDFGGVSADGKTLYEFDSGDNPSSPTTYVGIASSGGNGAGFTIQPFRFTGSIRSAEGIPVDLNGQVSGDANGDGVTDSTYDITLSQQNSLAIPNGQSVTYKTSTIFGEGSIADTTSDTSGCAKFNGLPINNRTVTVRQSGETNKTMKTDANGCYVFDNLIPGKAFNIVISGPKVPIPQ